MVDDVCEHDEVEARVRKRRDTVYLVRVEDEIEVVEIEEVACQDIRVEAPEGRGAGADLEDFF